MMHDIKGTKQVALNLLPPPHSTLILKSQIIDIISQSSVHPDHLSGDFGTTPVQIFRAVLTVAQRGQHLNIRHS